MILKFLSFCMSLQDLEDVGGMEYDLAVMHRNATAVHLAFIHIGRRLVCLGFVLTLVDVLCIAVILHLIYGSLLSLP